MSTQTWAMNRYGSTAHISPANELALIGYKLLNTFDWLLPQVVNGHFITQDEAECICYLQNEFGFGGYEVKIPKNRLVIWDINTPKSCPLPTAAKPPTGQQLAAQQIKHLGAGILGSPATPQIPIPTPTNPAPEPVAEVACMDSLHPEGETEGYIGKIMYNAGTWNIRIETPFGHVFMHVYRKPQFRERQDVRLLVKHDYRADVKYAKVVKIQ